MLQPSMNCERSWRPCLTGELARAATEVLDQLVFALQDDDGASSSPSELGYRALLWSYLDRARPGGDFGWLATQALTRGVDQLAETHTSAGLLGGFTGMAWLVDRLHPDASDDLNEAIDETLLQLLELRPWPHEYDLVSGLAGFGVYALGRIERPRAREILGRVVRQLGSLAEPRSAGQSWLSSPELMIPLLREQWPRGHYNFGVAHGVAAIALVMAGAMRAGIEAARAEALYVGAQRWIWASRLPTSFSSSFGSCEQEGVPLVAARLAWCYGDAGMATTLHCAATTVGDAPRARLALDVARRSVSRSLADSGVRDAGLCHGSAGLALLYSRLYNVSGEALFASAARRWFAHVLEQHRPNRGVGGYQSWRIDHWHDDASFLEGATGVALALLAGTSDIAPDWDQALAASLPEVSS